MKTYISTLLVGMTLAAQAQAASLEDRVSELEANQSLNIFRFSGSLVNRTDMIDKKPETVTATDVNENVTINRLKFSLNVDADVSSRLKVYSTFTTSKTWNMFARQNDTTYQAAPYNKELGGNTAYRDSEVVLEKAYFDYSMASAPVVFSMGRLPTYYGSPTHLWDQKARMGTYPKLAYSAMLDGAALTFKVPVPSNQSLALRAIYTPFSHRNFSGGVARPRYNGNAVQDESTSSTLALMADYTLRGETAFDELNFIVQYIDLSPMRFEDLSGVYRSDVEFGHKFTTVHAEVTDIAQSGVSIAATYLNTKTESRGIATLTAGNTPVGTYLGSGASADLSGGIMLLSSTFKIPVESLNSPVLGLEYQKGDKEAVGYDFVSDDLTSFYVNRGQGYHAYLSQKIDDNLSVRLGYMKQERKHGSGAAALAPLPFGGINDTKYTFETAYANVRVDF